jgi:hypothetical protein
MRLLFTSKLILFTISLFSNSFVNEPIKNHKSFLCLNSGENYTYHFAPPKKKRKSKLKYGMIAFSGGISHLSPTGNSYNTFTTEPSHIFEFLLSYNRLFMGLSGTTPTLKARKNTFQNKTAGLLIEEGEEINYNILLFKLGYSGIFKKKFRLTPYINYGIGTLESDQIKLEEEIKDEKIYSGLTVGAGVKAKYFIIETDPKHIYGKMIPGTIGISFDAGYNYQFAEYSLPIKGHTFYASLGLFIGISFKNK